MFLFKWNCYRKVLFTAKPSDFVSLVIPWMNNKNRSHNILKGVCVRMYVQITAEVEFHLCQLLNKTK